MKNHLPMPCIWAGVELPVDIFIFGIFCGLMLSESVPLSDTFLQKGGCHEDN